MVSPHHTVRLWLDAPNPTPRPGAPATAKGYSVFLHGLDTSPVVIVGIDSVASEKAEELLGFGAAVRVIAPSLAPGPRLVALIRQSGFEHLAREYASGDIETARLTIVCDKRAAVRQAVRADSRQPGCRALVIVPGEADAKCDATCASVHSCGPRLTIAVAADGVPSRYVERLPKHLAAGLGEPDGIAQYLDDLASLYEQLHSYWQCPHTHRQRILRALLDSGADARYAAGDVAGGRSALVAALRRFAAVLEVAE